MVSEQTRNTILRLAIGNKSPREIYAELKKTVSIGVIYKTLSQARDAGMAVPNFRGGGELARRKILTKHVIKALGPHARERRCTVAELAGLLLSRIASDDLVEAVLDDSKGREKRRPGKR